MAQRTIVTYVDDLDDSPIEEGKGGPVSFALDGKSYTIDLNDKNAAALRKVLDKYLAVAKPIRGGRASRSGRPGRNESANEIREWAKQNGFEVSERGRISKEVQDAWDAR